MSVARAGFCVSALLIVALLTPTASACWQCEAHGLSGCVLAACVSDPDGASATDGDAPEIARFTLQGGQQPQPGGDGSPITVTYSYNNFLDGGLKDPEGVSVPAWYLRVVTEEAFDLWASVAPIHFVEVPDVGTPVYTSNTTAYRDYDEDDFGTIRLNHRYINGTDAQNGGPTTKALAWFPFTQDPLGSDIHFDNGDPWAVVGTPSEPDVLGILAHEIGHTLGIGHSSLDGAVMFPAALRREGPGTGYLTDDDIAAVQAIYGSGTGSVTPLFAVPEPAAGALLLLAALGCLPARRRAG